MPDLRRVPRALAVAAVLAAALLRPPATAAGDDPGHPWLDPARPVAERVDRLLGAMTQDEKLNMIRGHGLALIPRGRVAPVPRLGIPELRMHDGPHGVSDVRGVTAFPAPVTLAATWDTALARRFGAALGAEARGKGVNVYLAPAVDILRVPQSGRAWESFGEDPYLASAMAGEEVAGIRGQNVIATVKHYIGNNQETDRMRVDAVIDERTLREIYYPPFEAAVDAGAGAVMCAYNKVNGPFACENPQTLTAGLKDSMGFEGWVMSDWLATRSGQKAALAGLDQAMPDDPLFAANLKAGIALGTFPAARLDDMVRRVLTPMFADGLFETGYGAPDRDVRTPEHTALARDIAVSGTVLLKNRDGILPLTGGRIAVIGTAAHDNVEITSAGSGRVLPPYVVTPYQGLNARAGGTATYSPGDAEGALPWDVDKRLREAADAAQRADVAVVVVGLSSQEGEDRPDLGLPGNMETLIETVAAANPRTVVVLTAPAQVLMPWADRVKGVVSAFVGGQELGNALASVLYGDADPGGRLPMTFAARAADYPASTAEQFPGVGHRQVYSERLLVGYRHFDATALTPLFPFGHGLSYTSFSYDSLSISGATVRARVTNTGSRAGVAVPQLYLGFPAEAGEPPRQLRGFARLRLAPGESATVAFRLPERAFQVWTPQGWSTVRGDHTVEVGASSRDLPLSGTLTR
ncbi:beta-glucosidase family protein [Streptosporangium canum]|uniref:beta-glucosidase family protein n=1 Tax=Streptosporangium canum TaxID=324952 RepID=UPI003418D051